MAQQEKMSDKPNKQTRAKANPFVFTPNSAYRPYWRHLAALNTERVPAQCSTVHTTLAITTTRIIASVCTAFRLTLTVCTRCSFTLWSPQPTFETLLTEIPKQDGVNDLTDSDHQPNTKQIRKSVPLVTVLNHKC
jgi:hypothetical protein